MLNFVHLAWFQSGLSLALEPPGQVVGRRLQEQQKRGASPMDTEQ